MPDAEVPRTPRDVYCYFDNTDKLHAPKNARRLMQMLDIRWEPSGTVRLRGEARVRERSETG